MGNTGLIWATVILGLLMLVCSFIEVGYMPSIDTKNLATKTDVSNALASAVASIPQAPAINTSGLLKKEDIAPLLADDKWETEALKIATDEWSDKDNKDIYIAIDDAYGNIVDKEDISYVKVTDDDVRRADAEDKDARVIQEIKVRYESTGGDEVNKYFRITTEIRDGDVDEQDIVPYTP